MSETNHTAAPVSTASRGSLNAEAEPCQAFGQGPSCRSVGGTAVSIYGACLEGETTPAHVTSHHLVERTCVDQYDYWQGMSELWGENVTLVNIEHDMEFSDVLVAELLDCPHPRCSHAYICWVPQQVWAHTYDGCGLGGTWIIEHEEWAGYSAIGFCKLTREARTLPLGRTPWNALERAVNDASPGPWHIHWPGVSHYKPFRVTNAA